jgi:hypothetical protein
MCTNDLEGIVAKRLADPYDTRVRWLKIKNPDYSQKVGRAELFNRVGVRVCAENQPFAGRAEPTGSPRQR